MPQIASNFIFNSKESNFERDSFKTFADMVNVESSHIDEGHISYCESEEKHYIFRTGDPENPFTGADRWVELSRDVESGVIERMKELTPTIHTVYTLEDLTDDLAKDLSFGSLVYVKSVDTYYYNAYDKTKQVQDVAYIECTDPIDHNGTGWFRLLVNQDFSDELAAINGRLNDIDSNLEDIKTNYTEQEAFDEHVQNFEDYKKFVDETYAKPDEVFDELNNYNPSEEYLNRWVALESAEKLVGLSGENIKGQSYNEIVDKIIFSKYIPSTTLPAIDVELRIGWDDNDTINWYDEKNKIILLKAETICPDGNDFLPINPKDAIIQYPKGINIDNKFTNGLVELTDNQQISTGFCKIKNEKGEWDYYKKDNNIYHVPSELKEGEYRYYIVAYFKKGAQALNNDNEVIAEWNEKTPVESNNYITVIASKPTYYNTLDGFKENPLKAWTDEIFDEAELLPSCQLEQSFKTPRKLKKLYIWNDLTGGYAEVPNVNGIPAYFSEVIGEDGYYTYIYDSLNNGHRGAIKIKMVF